VEPLLFDKYEGLGNDFIVVDTTRDDAVPAAMARRLCDRHFGIGADGVLLVLPPRAPGCDARMRVVNADGSIPEMCGNGIRCVALRLARGRGIRNGKLVIETDAGPRACVVEDDASVTVDMGVVRVTGDRTVDIDGHPVLFTLADAGNPHAVTFGTFTRAEAERLGPRVATHGSFPAGTNVELARVASDGIDLVVWERGVGITMACGTGACATLAVACEKGLAPRGRATRMRLPGGVLEVTLDADGRARMRGPAHHVFTGRTAG
jgi:diaminopimelate epimerase